MTIIHTPRLIYTAVTGERARLLDVKTPRGCLYRARPRQLHEVVLDLVHVAVAADVHTLQMSRLELVLGKDPLGHHAVRTGGLEEDHHFAPSDFGLDELLRHVQSLRTGSKIRPGWDQWRR